MRTIISYICHNINLQVLAWKYDYIVITDHFHFPRFLLVKKIPNKDFQVDRWRRSLCCYKDLSFSELNPPGINGIVVMTPHLATLLKSLPQSRLAQTSPHQLSLDLSRL
jgi:hypothetical protein